MDLQQNSSSFFWIDMGKFIHRSINFGYNKGEMSVTQKQGIITCIPKDDKPRQFMKIGDQ